MDWYERTRMLIGNEAVEKLAQANVIIFGVGGVGSYISEAVARAGVGNRSTIGSMKTQVMADRIKEINPSCNVKTINEFVLYDNIDDILTDEYNYVADAVDTVTAKLAIIMKARELNVPVISSMGTGNKLHPEMLEITDVFKTSVCPLAKVMRKELKDRGIKKLKVCYSKEIPLKPLVSEEVTNKRSTPGSISFVPSTAGLLIAGEIIRDICSL